MPKLIVYVNAAGRVFGAVRGDPIETEDGILQAVVPERRTGREGLRSQHEQAEVSYHEIEVPENLLASRPEDFHQELERRVKSQTAKG
jgi:hypothetical protein